MFTDPAILEYISGYIKKAVKKDRRVLVFFRTLDPAFALKKIYGDGLALASGDYKFPLKQFADGEIQALIATDKLAGEGVNIPGIDVLIQNIQNSSDIMTFQCLGRALRKGDKKPIIIEFVPSGIEMFEKSFEKRLKVYRHSADNVYIKNIVL